MNTLWQALPTFSPITLGWLLLTAGVFLIGLARFLDLFRPRH